MRWPIRWQLLAPPLTLLVGVAGVSALTAWASASRARHQIETRLRNLGGGLSDDRKYPLNQYVLDMMPGLSGAEYLLVPREGERIKTKNAPAEPPAEAVCDD